MRTLIIVILITPLIIATSGSNPVEPKGESAQSPSAILSKAETNREKVVSELSPLSFLVGDWRGVAQPRRGSNSGAWSEKTHTVWRFDEKIPCLLMQLEPGTKSTRIFFAASSETGRPIVELQQPEKPSIALEMTEPEESPASGSTAQTDKSAQDHWVFQSVTEPGKTRMAHPEWCSTIWARARTRLASTLTGPAVRRSHAGFLACDPSTLIAVQTDSIMTTTIPEWATGTDDGRPGRYRVTKDLLLPGRVVRPVNLTQLQRMKDKRS